MNWLGRLLGRDSLSPELHEQVPRPIRGRRGVIAPSPSAPPKGERAGAADLDEATSLRNQPTWRDDVEGRMGPKW